MKKFYFTYGTSPAMPHFGGWTTVCAKNFLEAIDKYAAKYPPNSEGLLRCSFYYFESEFKKTEMYKDKSNLGAGEHDIIR